MFFKRLYHILDKICEPISCACLAVVVSITIINVVMRYVFSAPLPWIEEVSALLFTYLVFFGLSVTHKRGSTVSVDIIVMLMPPKMKRIMTKLSIILNLAIWCALVVLGCKLAISTSNSVTAYLRIPYHYLYWFFPISGFFCVVQLLNRLFDDDGSRVAIEEI